MVVIAIDSGKTKTNAAAIDGDLRILCRASGRGGGLIYGDDEVKGALKDVILKCLNAMGVGADSIDLILISWADLDTETYWVKARRIVEALRIISDAYSGAVIRV